MSKTIEGVQITNTEKPLLLTAFAHWNNAECFSDEQVADVKTIFQRVFDDTTKLTGKLFGDALVMQPVNDKSLHYAMVVDGEVLVWKKAITTSISFQVLDPSLPFEDFLMMAGTTPIMDTDDTTLVYDFFKFWKRQYSPTKLARVAQKGEPKRSTSEYVQRTGATLVRMYRELRLLGFEDYTRVGRGRIDADWVDPEKLAAGCAPQSFSISLRGDDGFETDYAAWANDAMHSDTAPSLKQYFSIAQPKSYGVFIDETHGPEAICIESWDEWDEWLVGNMKPLE
jgi:hypothetical protein